MLYMQMFCKLSYVGKVQVYCIGWVQESMHLYLSALKLSLSSCQELKMVDQKTHI